MIRERLARWFGAAPAAAPPESRIAEAAGSTVTRAEEGWRRRAEMTFATSHR